MSTTTEPIASSPSPISKPRSNFWLHFSNLLVSIVVAAIVYTPAIRDGGFIWDDDDYVTENMTLRSVEGLRAIWFEPGAVPQYYPLVHTTFWLEYHAWGLNPRGYHIVNVMLHGLSCLLLFLILLRLKVSAAGAMFVAMVFAVHPVHVESVAWITERKNVLSLVFYLGSALAYLRFLGFVGIGEEEKGNRRWLYAGALLLFVCALLSKTVTASLPAALLLVIYWQRGRVTMKDVAPLLPFFALGIAFGLLTAWMERTRVGAVGPEWDLTFIERCLVAGRAVWFYAGKLIVPYPLAFIYPKWAIDSGAWWQYIFPVTAVGLVAALWALRNRIGRGTLVAVLFFGGTLFPALGFINVFPHKFSWVADHFQYHASIGMIVLLCVGAERLLVRRIKRPNWRAIEVVVIVVLGVLTWNQAGIYKDYATVWRDTLIKNPKSPIVLTSNASVLVSEGRTDEAIELYLRALETSPTDDVANFNLGKILVERGHLEDAEKYLAQSIESSPDCGHCHYFHAVAVAQQGRPAEAVPHYEASLRITPDDPYVHYNFGVTLMELERPADAAEHFRAALAGVPDMVLAFIGLGDALAATGEVDGARDAYRQARRRAPGNKEIEEKMRMLSGDGMGTGSSKKD